VKRPQCPKCGNPELAKTGGTPIVFHSRAADTGTDAGYRAEPPETTFSRYAFHISPVTGIVKSVIPSPWNNMGPLKIYTAGHNLAIKNENLFFLKNNLRTNSSGKGRTDSQARTSALCEAIERYSGLYKGEESRITSTFNRLKDAAIHPNNCMLFSEEQYLKRNEWNSKGEQFSIVPLPFDKNNEIEWSPVYSYTQKKIKYLPTAYLYYAYPIPFDKAFTLADSNGNAAGSCFEDACLQGLLEVVERDSMAIWWYNRLRKPGFDLASLNDAYINEVIEFYKKYNREFWVLDITTDIGIPAFAALNRRTSGPTEDIMFGLGCHVDARTAINRAITEMNQFMPAVLNTLPDSETNYQWGDPAAIKWWKTVTVKNQEYLTPDPAHTKTIKDYKEIKDRDILKYLEQCISKMESLGHEVLILNQTRPDIGLDVVKVIIPGMRHFWTRFAPGRLYDVPVKMGWLKKKKTEAELNPIAMFL
jgi:ribosomal protein S12 methylthiotransferase accessory factor